MIENYINGKWHFIPGNGKAIANYVFVDDIVDGHIKAFLKGKAGEKYILGGSNLSYNELFSFIKSISGKSYFLIKIPKVYNANNCIINAIANSHNRQASFSNKRFYKKGFEQSHCKLFKSDQPVRLSSNIHKGSTSKNH